jgi:hypothetical protein
MTHHTQQKINLALMVRNFLSFDNAVSAGCFENVHVVQDHPSEHHKSGHACD